MNLIRSSIVVSLSSFANMLLSMAAQQILAAYFGAGTEMDAFLLAQVIPLYLQGLLVSGITVATVPIIIREKHSFNNQIPWDLIGTLWKVLALLMSLLAVLSGLFSAWILNRLAAGADIVVRTTAVDLLPIIALALPFQAVGTLASGVRNAQGDFFVSTISTGIGIAANILVLFFFHSKYHAVSIAVGFLVGAVVQCIVSSYYLLIKSFLGYKSLRDPVFREMLKLIWPIIIFGTVGRAIPVFERYFAAGLVPGAISYLAYANRISSILDTLVGAAIATTLLPEMARQFTLEGRKGVAQVYGKALKSVCYLIFPVLIVGIIQSEQIVKILFFRGGFSEYDATQTAVALPYFLIASLFLIMGTVIGRLLYVQGQTFTFNFLGAITVLLYPVFAHYLVPIYGFIGLAQSSALVSFLGVVIGCILVYRNINKFFERFILFYLFAAVMTYFLIIKVIYPLSFEMNDIFQLIITTVLSFSIYFAITLFFDGGLRAFLFSRASNMRGKV